MSGFSFRKYPAVVILKVALQASVSGALIVVFFTEPLFARGLPAWTPGDRERIQRGELIAGASLLVEDASALPLPGIAPEPEVPSIEPVVPELEYNPRFIPVEYLEAYFERASNKYLVDPQRLLSMQESLDREGFLDYHADNSEIDIKMYLFDAQQEIPAPYNLEKLVRDHYSDHPLTVIVFCFLGDPSRNKLAFAGRGAAAIKPSEIQKIRGSAEMKALEKSDPAAQAESFIVQLSIRLYWMEKYLTDAVAASTQEVGKRTESESDKSNIPLAPSFATKLKPYFFLYAVVGIFGTFLSIFSGAAAWVIWRRTSKYHFAPLELPRRLGADYAAGVGAVIEFNDKLGSPSSQRDQVPDYITRI